MMRYPNGKMACRPSDLSVEAGEFVARAASILVYRLISKRNSAVISPYHCDRPVPDTAAGPGLLDAFGPTIHF
jgi:hypothetical protein